MAQIFALCDLLLGHIANLHSLSVTVVRGQVITLSQMPPIYVHWGLLSLLY